MTTEMPLAEATHISGWNSSLVVVGSLFTLALVPWHYFPCLGLVPWHYFPCLGLVQWHNSPRDWVWEWDYFPRLGLVPWHYFPCLGLVPWHYVPCLGLVQWHNSPRLGLVPWHVFPRLGLVPDIISLVWVLTGRWSCCVNHVKVYGTRNRRAGCDARVRETDDQETILQ